jgi:DinB family protein
MKSSPAEIQKALLQLEQTALRLAAAASGLGDEALQSAPNKATWSAAEILAHLRACSDLWTHSIYAMLAEHRPELPDINERKWAKVTGYAALPFSSSLQAFALQREFLLPVLRALPPEQWERDALIFCRRHTVFTQTRRMAKHEAAHCNQVEALLRKLG